MNQLFSFLNPARLFRILTVFLVGLLVIFTTACSDRPANALNKNARPEVPSNAVSSPYRGGMNSYSDVDPRANTSGANRKANEIVEKAEANIQKGADSFDKYADNYRKGTPLNERVENLTEDVGESTKNTVKGVAKGAQRGVENLKENTQNAAKSVPDVVENAKENAGYLKSKADQALDNTQRAFNSHSVDVE